MSLVLSLFPGIGMLDMAFEQEGFCVVRGPDVLWGGDIRRFHPPAGVFDGVIGGPPCQAFSEMRRLLRATGRDVTTGNLIPEFVRCIESSQPAWFLMENVKKAPDPVVEEYKLKRVDLRHTDVGGDTKRVRRFWFGAKSDVTLNIEKVPRASLLPLERAVTRNCRVLDDSHRKTRKAKGGILPGDGKYMSLPDVCELQGLPRTFCDDSPIKVSAMRIALGNGVPLPMGRAMARAVKEAERQLTTRPASDQ